MNDNAKALGYGLVFVLALIFAVWFYSAKADGQGIVNSKWVETHTSTSCDSEGKNCRTTTSHSYMIQFNDGRVLSLLWGRRDYDRILEGSYIKYSARGRYISFLGWRIFNPTITSFEVLEGPPNSQ
jgi:hypothetical protein